MGGAEGVRARTTPQVGAGWGAERGQGGGLKPGKTLPLTGRTALPLGQRRCWPHMPRTAGGCGRWGRCRWALHGCPMLSMLSMQPRSGAKTTGGAATPGRRPSGTHPAAWRSSRRRMRPQRPRVQQSPVRRGTLGQSATASPGRRPPEAGGAGPQGPGRTAWSPSPVRSTTVRCPRRGAASEVEPLLLLWLRGGGRKGPLTRQC
jgi:hypothetical protein